MDPLSSFVDDLADPIFDATIEARVARQRDALLTLTAEPFGDDTTLSLALARIAEVASVTLSVSRVSIWKYNGEHTAIECLHLFDQDQQHGARPIESLTAAAHPNYFRVIAAADVVAVEDAMADPRTAEFADDYLRPLGIVSMMDVPIHASGRTIGVLCHEQVGRRRRWTNDEKAFAVALSSLIALAIERCELRRVQAELALQGAALNAVPYPTVITDRGAVIAWVNPAFTALTGYTLEEAVGRNSIDLLNSGRHDAAFFEGLWSALAEGRVWRGESWNRRKDGQEFIADQTVTPVQDSRGIVTHYVVVKIDLTEKRNLADQFLQAQKMEIVGRLAGGIAHDFNNLLTVINGTAELALDDLDQAQPQHADFERIRESGNRASALTRQLLAFSRKQVTSHKPHRILSVLNAFSGMLRRLIGEDIMLDVSGDPDAGSVLADESQLEQLILNLSINARDAMPRGGVLRIGVDRVELGEAEVAAHPGAKAGPHVRITVTDTGEGMSPEVREKVFEPFFTTKEAGKGTGLGLATVASIVKQSRGTIDVSSAVGVGTTFTICLPRVADVAGSGEAALPPLLPASSALILVVEDDEGVRENAIRILSSGGYTVLAAEDGDAALRLVANHPGKIDLIVSDVVLPDIGGHDLSSQVARLRPGVPILFTSGYTDDVVLARGVCNSCAQFIAKPYSTPALLRKVREMLDEPSGSTCHNEVRGER